LRLLVYPFDDISFLRVIAKPRRGFGPKAIENLRASGTDLMSALRVAKLSPKMRTAADEFLSAFDFDWASMSPADAAKKLLTDSGYMKMWSESKDVDAPDRLLNIRELLTSVIPNHETLPDFLEQAALMTTDDNDANDAVQNNCVRIMTVHAAKGLEFDTVFLPGWEEGIFPNEKSINEGGLEEERRLAYVAITRARRRCVISNSMMRIVFGSRAYNSPSRFITEIDNRYLDFQGGVPRTNNVSRSYDAPRPRHQPAVVKTMTGKLVNHDELGGGVVIEDGGAVLTIAFKNRGIKKVAREYVTVIG
jgi:DNA helicase-2/ATP-dependent DNA helicase PcrA